MTEGAAAPNSVARGSAKDTWFIIPAYNEEFTIVNVVNEALGKGFSVVVVDDASSDNTVQNANKSGAHIVALPINLGQGAAISVGLKYALDEGAEVIVTFDADGQHRLEDAVSMIKKLDEGFDVVLGNRFITKAGIDSVPKSRRLLLKLAVFYVRLISRLPVGDAHNGLRVLTRRAASSIKLTQPRMAHATEFLKQIRRLGVRWTEHSVIINYTPYSMSKGQANSDAAKIMLEDVKGGIKSFLR